MSGKPLINPSDASKYRQQYLATLALQANINDANLQANKIYKRTGQTPTQPTDMRLTSEKLADIERLKIEVRAQLASIMDGQDAQATISSLPTEALQFVAQNINQIVKEIKPRYALGIPATAFEVWLNNYMRKSSEVNEVAYGLQQNDGADVILGAEQIRELVNDEVLRQVREVIRRLGKSSEMGRVLENRVEELEPIVSLETELVVIGQIADTTVRYAIQKALNNIFNDISTKTEVNTIVDRLNLSIDRRDGLTETYANRLNEILSVDPSAVEDAKRVLLLIEDAKKGDEIPPAEEDEINYGGGEGEPSTKPVKQPPRDIEFKILQYERKYGDLRPDRYDNNKISKAELTTQIDDALKVLGYGSQNESRTARAFYINVMGGDKTTQSKLNQFQLKDVYRRVIEELIRDKEFVSNPSFSNYLQSSPPPTSDIELSTTSTLPYSKAPIRFGDEPISVKQGKGLVGKKRSMPVIDYTKGIPPVSKYVPFGNLFINTDKLRSGIVSVRKGKGVHITNLPVKRVSPHLNDIIGKILGGGNPSFGQLSKLNDDERDYLYKLGKYSNLLDKIGIEAPTKEDDDKDINQYEIYKGEIMSGNDSKEMVANFKKLIVKMIGKKLLPRGEAKLLLLDLAEMGY